MALHHISFSCHATHAHAYALTRTRAQSYIYDIIFWTFVQYYDDMTAMRLLMRELLQVCARVRVRVTRCCHPVLSYIVKWSSYPSVRLPVADPLAICIFWGHRSAGWDEPTGANRTGVTPGQVGALPAASLAPPGPEKGGAARVNPSSGTHFQITRNKSKSIISQVSSVVVFFFLNDAPV